MEVTITVTVNGSVRRITTSPDRSILDVFREDLRETGSKLRCGRGRCGGCVVLLDQKRVLACDIPIIEADQRSIETIEQ